MAGTFRLTGLTVFVLLHHLFYNFCEGQIGAATSKIQLINNGYEGILIAIENSVSEDPELLERIKGHFTEASRVLFTATRNRAYFRNITILVPGSWTPGSYADAGEETYSFANIVVHSDYKNVFPFVRQYTECGEGGEKIFLYWPYMITETPVPGSWAADFPHGKTLVHEWAHLQYGVFDEYPVDENDAQFYRENSNFIPVTCIKVDRALNEGPSGDMDGRCVLNTTTGLPDECKFVPHKQNPGITSSLMYNMAIESMTGFCDNDQWNPSTLHNAAAPNRQNKYCEGKSIWEVMREHHDFANGANPPLAGGEPPTAPQFKVVRATPLRIVLILDISGSMDGIKLARLGQDAAFYLTEAVPLGSHVGIVVFSTNATTTQPMMLVDGSESRAKLIAALPRNVDGWTCIGCGLERGITVLEDTGSTQGARFLLITDGDENRLPNAIDVLPDLKTKGITVDSFLYTENADSTLIDIAEATGGLAFFDSGKIKSTALLNGFMATVAQRQEPDSISQTSQLALTSVEIPAWQEVNMTVTVDSTVGNGTRFSFTHTPRTSAPFVVSIISPSGDNFTSNGPEATSMSDIGIVSVEIPGTAEPGTWKVFIKSLQSSLITTQLLVVSRPAVDGVLPYRVTATVKHGDFDYNELDSAKPVVIYADVRQHHAPVIQADVMAVVTYDNLKLRLPLYDNGVGSDLFKDDGIYSAYFTEFFGNGKYAVQIEVSSSNETAINNGQTGSPAPLPGQVTTNDITKIPDAFQRISSAGFVSLNNLPDPIPDLYPPARVNDLAVTSISYEEMTLGLEWTAVGDDMDQGQASKYEIRYSTEVHKVRSSFDSCEEIVEQQVLDGDLLTAQPSLSRETVQLNMSGLEANTTYFFGMRVWDEEDQVSQISNIVPVAFYPVEVAETEAGGDATTEHSSDVTESSSPDDMPVSIEGSEATTADFTPNAERFNTVVKLGIAVGCAVIVAVLVGIAAVLVIIRFKFFRGGKKTCNNHGLYQGTLISSVNGKMDPNVAYGYPSRATRYATLHTGRTPEAAYEDLNEVRDNAYRFPYRGNTSRGGHPFHGPRPSPRFSADGGYDFQDPYSRRF